MSAYNEWLERVKSLKNKDISSDDLYKSYMLCNAETMVIMLHEDMELRREHEKRVEKFLGDIASHMELIMRHGEMR